MTRDTVTRDTVTRDNVAGESSQPVAVRPAVPTPRPPTPPGPTLVTTRPTNRRRPPPGALICGNCGEGNDPNRRFCRRCGNPLAEAAVAPPLPWWKRLFGNRTAVKRTIPIAAGSRPVSITSANRLRHTGARVRNLVAAVIALAVAVVAIVPGFRHDVTDEFSQARQHIRPHYAEIPLSAATPAAPNGCSAPSISGNSTVYWYTKPVSSTAQALKVTFAPSFTGNLAKVGVTPIAASGGSGPTAASPAPSELQITGSSTVTPGQIVLANPPKFQSFSLKATAPRSLQITVLASDPTASASCAETAFIFYEKS